jgi:hypothetical protein
VEGQGGRRDEGKEKKGRERRQKEKTEKIVRQRGKWSNREPSTLVSGQNGRGR